MVFVFVVQNDVDFLGTRPTNIRSEHKSVGSFTMKVFLLKRTVEHFDVTTAAVNVLFMLDSELDH